MQRSDLALPRGSLVLVTGSNGYIASHIVDHLLQLGYRVRGTIRQPKPWLNEYFTDKYGEGKFETAIVPKIDVVGAFKEPLKGVDGIIHAVNQQVHFITRILNIKSISTLFIGV
jgi:nucleoside-diphosphate-sugar epimerase